MADLHEAVSRGHQDRQRFDEGLLGSDLLAAETFNPYDARTREGRAWKAAFRAGHSALAQSRERWGLEAGIQQRAADAAMLQVAVEHDGDAGAGANPARDQLCSLWIDRAPRFGAVAAHFPRYDRAAGGKPSVLAPWSGFVASFWAPEVFFSWPFDQPEGGWYTWPEREARHVGR